MIKVCKTTREELSTLYLKVLNGMLGLTDGELKLTACICDLYLEYGAQGLQEPFLSKFVFSTDGRKQLADKMEVSSQGLSNKLNQLVSKGALVKTDSDYHIHADLLPKPEVIIRMEVVDAQS